MNEFTPSNENIRDAWREVRPGRSLGEANAEFERWLDAHDQGIRDAVRPSTPADLIEAAWDAAYPLPEGRKLPAGTPYLWKDEPVEGHTRIVFWPNGEPIDTAYSEDVRTLDPLPPAIPDDCDHVWGTYDRGQGVTTRELWTRQEDDMWVCHAARTGTVAHRRTTDLIDPKPVPEEER